MPSPVAPQLAELVERLIGAPLPIRIRAWDGSESGPAAPLSAGEAGVDTVPVAIIRHRRALRRLLWNPGELGLARAFVAGELDFEGDIADGLSRFWKLARAQNLGALRLSAADVFDAAKVAGKLRILGLRPRPPASEARLAGGLHTRRRDRAAISHHYDLSNDFYRLLLDEHMAYSCAYFTRAPGSAGYTLHDAQTDKLDLVCRKLGLQPGQRLLDVGCGWGSMILHAAEHYGVHATGVTISAEQRDFITKRVAERGVQDKVTVRLQDYREVSDGPYDAISTIEMGEHVGAKNYDAYTATLFRLLKPRGRLLLQQMSRTGAPGGGAFIESYIAPDMTMVPLGTTANNIERAGFEIRDVHVLREHYVHTIRGWLDTFEQRFAEVTGLIGQRQSRVWRLYLVGSALAFEENRMGVDQFLAVKPDAAGVSGLPRTRDDWSVRGN